MRAQLTKRIVATAQSQAKPYEMRDTLSRGLILRVQPSGHKAWIVTWAHGKRRTLGAVDHVTLEQARAQAVQAMADVVQQRLPSLANAKVVTCSLGEFLTDRYEPWARVELRRGSRYAQRIRTHFANLLKRQLHEIDVPTVDRWWRERLSEGQGREVTPVVCYIH